MPNNNKNNNAIHPIGTSEVQYIRRNNIQQRTSILPTPRKGPIPAGNAGNVGTNLYQATKIHTRQNKKYVKSVRKQDTTQRCEEQKCHPDKHNEHNTETTRKTGAHPTHKHTAAIPNTHERSETTKQHHQKLNHEN